MLPEAVAYASIAGLPPQRAILAGLVGGLAYVVLGRSRFAIVAPTSSSAAILAATLAAMPLGAAGKAAIATLVVGLVGAIFLLAAATRLGGLTGFISRPVLRGFAFGLAITIIVGQLSTLVGIGATAPDLAHRLVGLATTLPAWHWPSLTIGALALAALLALRRWPAVPGAFVVLVGGIAAAALFDLPARGVATVGPIVLALAWPAPPALSWGAFSSLIEFTLPLVLILFAESWGSIRALALRHGDVVDANRELGALGLANLASAVVQGMPVGAGFSAAAASEASGAASRWTSVLAVLVLALLVLLGGPAIALLPKPVVAAVVIAAVGHALDPAPFLRLWKLGRDQYVALAAAAGVLLFGVLDGMMLAIVLSLAAMVQRLATPTLARLGRLGGGHAYVDLARHPDAVSPPGIAIWRPTEPLFFANAERMFGLIRAQTRADPAIRAIVVSLEESFDLDSTALEVLVEFDRAMTVAGLRLQMARVHDRVRDLLAAAGAGALLARCSYSVDEAVETLGRDVQLAEPPHEP